MGALRFFQEFFLDEWEKLEVTQGKEKRFGKIITTFIETELNVLSKIGYIFLN